MFNAVHAVKDAQPLESPHELLRCHNGQLAPGMKLLTEPFRMETLGRRIREIIEDAG